MATECAGGGELPQLVADHRLGDEHRDVLTAVMHRDRVPQHDWDDHGAARPRLDDVPRPLVVLGVHLLQQVVVHKGTLLQATRHYQVLLPLLLAAPADDQPVARLVLGPGPAFRLAPRADRMAPAGTLALAAAQRVVDRVHGHATHRGPLAFPPVAAGLAELDVALLGVADLAHGGAAARVHPADLARGHPELGVPAFLRQQLHAGTGRPGDLGAAAGPQLDGVHQGAGRDVAQRQAVPRADVGGRAVLHPVPRPQPLRAEDVALLAVGVVQQRDARGAVRVVLHLRDLGGHAVLVRAAEVDQPVGALVTAALVPGGDPAVHIPPAPGVDRADERLLRLAAGDLGEVRAARAPPARGRRLVLTDGHVCSSSCRVRGLGDRPAKDVDPLARRQRHDGPLGVGALAPAVPGAAALARPVDRVDAGDLHPEDLLDRLPDLGLVGLGSNQEGVLAVVHQPVALLRDHRLDQDIPWISDLAHSSSSFCAAPPEEADLREVPELRCLTTGGAASPSASSAASVALAVAVLRARLAGALAGLAAGSSASSAAALARAARAGLAAGSSASSAAALGLAARAGLAAGSSPSSAAALGLAALAGLAAGLST